MRLLSLLGTSRSIKYIKTTERRRFVLAGASTFISGRVTVKEDVRSKTMSQDDASVQLLKRWQQGDEAAADEIFARYMQRLAGLARNRLSEKMQRRVDPEDVVQSVYRSFFRHAKEDRYELKRSGDLWRLLASITINKTMGQIEYHTAKKRAIADEGSWPDSGDSSLNMPAAISREPTVEDAVALTDEIEAYMQTLDPIKRQILELRLQDQSTEEIASAVDRSSRTVRRVLEDIKSALAERLASLEED